MKLSLSWFFTLHAALNALALSITVGLLCLLSPLYNWLFTHQLKWMSLNLLLRYVLWGVFFGIAVSGILTVYEWSQRTNVPIMKKILVITVATSIITVVMFAALHGIKLILPIS